MTINTRRVAVGLITGIVIVYVILSQVGLIGLWKNGIRYITANSDHFSSLEGHFIQGEYTISIDLSNLKSNLGKVLYDDGSHRIYISYLEKKEKGAGSYQIGFRSSGQYSMTGATLVTGNQHVMFKDNSFTTYTTAKMTAEYKGRTYSSSSSGFDGINYRDGDGFYFYIFPSEAYDEEIIEGGTVKLTVSDLYYNKWNR